ncbi:MAG TPA: tetraspanin family protein [Rubrobacteraceae bacterium]|nr:tetraspanin family protein [Rubrobacteraceae bacterium]
MSESSNDQSRERRRTGPLGGGDEDTRQQAPQSEKETRQIPEQQPGGGEARTRRATRKNTEGDARETQVMRSSGAAPGGYFEAMEEREERLRDIYGGTDWLASFLGFIFAIVGGAVLALIPALVLIPLGFSIDLSGGSLGTAAITGLAIVGVVLFLMYFFGGYVAGRLARFDGGLNGVMLLVWTVIVGVLLVLAGGIFSSFLPAGVAENMQSFIQGTMLPGFNNLVAQGAIGIAILIAAVLVALLGAFVGGRTGARYHRDIDYTL